MFKGTLHAKIAMPDSQGALTKVICEFPLQKHIDMIRIKHF